VGSRIRARSAIGFGLALVVAGCAGSRSISGSPAVGATAAPAAVAISAPPTVVPSIAATLDEQVAAACSGAAVPGSAPFGGTVHPLYVVTGGDVQRADQQGYSFDSADSRLAWLREEWTSPLQLVVCVGGSERMKIESCGDYANSYGQSFEVVRYRLVRTVTIVDAATGAVRGTDRVPGSDPPECTATVSSFDLVGGEPDVYKFGLTLAGE
jgi:hypothetical protein